MPRRFGEDTVQVRHGAAYAPRARLRHRSLEARRGTWRSTSGGARTRRFCPAIRRVNRPPPSLPPFNVHVRFQLSWWKCGENQFWVGPPRILFPPLVCFLLLSRTPGFYKQRENFPKAINHWSEKFEIILRTLDNFNINFFSLNKKNYFVSLWYIIKRESNTSFYKFLQAGRAVEKFNINF